MERQAVIVAEHQRLQGPYCGAALSFQMATGEFIIVLSGKYT